MRKPVSKVLRKRKLLMGLYVGLLMGMLGFSLSALLVQEVFATTYVITDGEQVMTCTTFATDPAKVLTQAGVSLDRHDTYTTEAAAGRASITIRRAQHITVRHDGKLTTTTSMGETVGELLNRLELTVSGEDVISHSLTAETFDGMVVTVERIAQVRETYSATVPHAVTHLQDAALPEGTEQVLTDGVDGEVLVTADVTYVDGRAIARTTISETQIQAPVTEVIAVGTGARQPEPSEAPIITDSTILLPTGELLTYTHTDTVRATAYTHTDEGCDTLTATGTKVRWGTVAVDPRYIPYGTRMFIMSSDGSYIYGIATAEDCGGDIKGDRMDLYMPTYEQCREFGRKRCTLYFLG